MNAGSIVVYIGANTLGLKKGARDVKAFEREVNTMASSVSKSTEAMSLRVTTALGAIASTAKATGFALTRLMTVPALAAVGIGSKLFSDYEYNLSKVTGLVGISVETVKKWDVELLNLSKTVGRSPKELSEALYFITSAGIRGTEVMELLEYASKGAAVGMGTTADIAKLAASAMNAYADSNLTAVRAMDVITMTIREGQVEADKLVQSMGIVLPIASKMGVTFDQVGAGIAAMTRTGTKASTAAMQFRQILQKLLKPAKQSENAVNTLGSSFQELRETIAEKGILTALTDIDKLTKIFGIQTLAKVIPNIRALSAQIDLTGANYSKNVEIFKNTEDALNTLDKAFENVSMTMKQKWSILLVSMKVAMIEFGRAIKDGLLPILVKFTHKLADLTEWFKKLDVYQKESLLRWVAFAAIFPPLLILLGSMINAFLRIYKVLRMIYLFFAAMSPAYLYVIAGAISVVAYAMLEWYAYTQQQRQAQKDFNVELKDTKEILTELGTLYEKAGVGVNRMMNEYGKSFSATGLTEDAFGNIESALSSAQSIRELRGYYDEAIRMREEYVANATKAYKDAGVTDLKFIEEITTKGITKWNVLIAMIKEYIDNYKKAVDLRGLGEEAFDRLKVRMNLESTLKQNEAYKKLIPTFDLAKANLSAYTAALKKLIAIGGEEPKYLKSLADEINRLTASTKSGAASLKNSPLIVLYKTLEDFKKYKELVPNFDIAKASASAYTTALKEMIKIGGYSAEVLKDISDKANLLNGVLSPDVEDSPLTKIFTKGTEDFVVKSREQIKALEKIRKTGERTKVSLMDMTQFMKENTNAVKEWSDVASFKALTLGKMFDDVFKGMSNVIENALNSTENVFQAFAKSFGMMIKGMIVKMMGAIVTALLLATIIQFIPGLGQIGSLKGVITGGAGEWLNDVKALLGLSAIGMADGGIIPKGYPNDTFRTNLSSNEAVIPLERLPQLMADAGVGGGNNQKVEFYIHGRDLKGIMADADAVSKAY